MTRTTKPVSWLWLSMAAMLTPGVLCPSPVLAQVPARFYLKSLAGGSAIPLIYESISGNANPFDPSHGVNLGADSADLDADMALAGIESRVPVDQVIDCMGDVGRRMPVEFRETALGGLAATPFGQEIKEQMQSRRN